uniref:Peptidase M20 dimerisation domain-containing protein n=1 Tax=Rhodosorus marinus TaxID=101924 RepID=A0A7S3A5R1_9RHOD|mmetsp:Transcript_45872/g.178202  ORF Transcript_45872/g.178202 Transcript_45872/m.178202 type:complete len:447 (+) Transcript_45872:233-1573(+)|eukprot:CAMPEP_0113955698 /NCGR_PEP_ID=MMETSP0011_2-20120614/1529_1 /TAXON_ID=101924 /ORGANISM="Rhodosorus marinus" /LENGTH=446 /DNA_ID=CAMNT_0000965519 /DNA_START=127 /DNA_END=1467 /DNA_ORIENTATION=+ /assembly_acc=CAM_ASM_000156
MSGSWQWVVLFAWLVVQNWAWAALLQLEVDGSRVERELKELRRFSDTAAPNVTRILYTQSDSDARDYLRRLFKEEDLIVREDAIGNIFARWPGQSPDSPAIGTGSHFDAIPFSGMYDGTVGVVGALEAIRALKRSGFRPVRSIEILAFTSEEPTRFGIGCLGSRALTGLAKPEDLKKLVDTNNTSFDQARFRAGYTDKVVNIELSESYYDGFIELHIEQGPELEKGGIDVGVVTAIAAPAQLEVTFRGDGGHAGALLMHLRNDALLAGAELAIDAEKAALSKGTRDTVVTSGSFEIAPNTVNSVPRHAKLGIDVRDIDEQRRDAVLEIIINRAVEIATARGVEHSVRVSNKDPPAESSLELVRLLEDSADQLNFSHKRMVSRAYHDSLFMAAKFRAAMLFIPCRDGISHRPDEYASEEAISKGVLTLAHTLAKLSSSAPREDEPDL